MSTLSATAFVSGEDFKDARLHATWTIPVAAERLRVTQQTIRNWEAGARRVPFTAFELVRVLGCHFLPGKNWQGWRVVGDTLYSSEGLGFKASDMGWWGLTCALARHWLNRHREQPQPLPADLSLLLSLRPEDELPEHLSALRGDCALARTASQSATTPRKAVWTPPVASGPPKRALASGRAFGGNVLAAPVQEPDGVSVLQTAKVGCAGS